MGLVCCLVLSAGCRGNILAALATKLTAFVRARRAADFGLAMLGSQTHFEKFLPGPCLGSKPWLQSSLRVFPMFGWLKCWRQHVLWQGLTDNCGEPIALSFAGELQGNMPDLVYAGVRAPPTGRHLFRAVFAQLAN